MNKDNCLFPPEIIKNTAEAHFARNSRKTSLIYWAILICMICAFGSLPFIKIDVTAQSRGIIRSSQENNPLYTVVHGTIEKLNFRENQFVQKGDTLIELKTDLIDQKLSVLQQTFDKNAIHINDLEALTNHIPKNITSLKYKSEFQEYLAQLRGQKLETKALKEIKEVSDHLFEKGIEPALEHKRVVNRYKTALKKEEIIVSRYSRQWNNEIDKLKQLQLELEGTINELQEDRKKYLVVAPISGTVFQTKGLKVGNFIAPSQPIAQISPHDELIAECYITPKDIGLFQANMQVRLQLDAYNYNQWGMLEGKVKSISDDITIMDNRAVFKVRCIMNQQALYLKNGKKGEIKKGMTFTGRFFLTERTLAQMIFDKANNWLNPKIVAK